MHLRQAQLMADQLGDKASVALIETLRHLYQGRAGVKNELVGLAEPAARHAEAADSLTVYLFGSCRVFLNGTPIGGWRKKSEALFKYLVSHRAIPIHRDKLLDIFWPDTDPQAARNCLNVTLHALRRILEAGGSQERNKLIHFADDHYYFNPALKIWIDTDAFNEQHSKGQSIAHLGDCQGAISYYEMADALYTGDFLESDRYEDWTINLRERLRINYLALLIDLGQLYYEVGNYAAALECNQKILDRDDCHEDAHRQAMRCYYSLGQRGRAIYQYQLCCKTLTREFGIGPMKRTADLYEEIRNGSESIDNPLI
jgi:DNA-binding SARP family transcriptional activator